MKEAAGAASRISIGMSVLGGMLVSTILSLYVIPVFYVMAKGLQLGRKKEGSGKKEKVVYANGNGNGNGHGNGNGNGHGHVNGNGNGKAGYTDRKHEDGVEKARRG